MLCNGVQNLCALTKDESIAKDLGLVPTEERGDIYGFVAKEVIADLTVLEGKPKHKNHDLAVTWLKSDLIDRNFLKAPVMTRSYAATLYGIKQGVQRYVKKAGKERLFEDLQGDCDFMGKKIWDVMDKCLARPMSVMNYFQAVAKTIGKSGQPLRWTTPTGMSCYHAPRKQKPKNCSYRT